MSNIILSRILTFYRTNLRKPRLSKRTTLLVKAAIALVMIGVLINRIQMQEIWNALLHARLLLILTAFLMLPLNVGLQYQKWALLVRSQYPVTRTQIITSLLAGFTLGFITPGRLEYGRALFIDSVDRFTLVGLTLLEKIYAMLVIYFLGTLSLLHFLPGS